MNRATPKRALPGAPARTSQAGATVPPARPTARARFLATDLYRADREWKRYEGTPQRDLFRELRHRFLLRHAVPAGWVGDIGAGPRRFTSSVGGPSALRVALDLSREMLSYVPSTGVREPGGRSTSVERVAGDAMSPPFAPGVFEEVALVGNALGFSGSDWRTLLDAIEALLAPGGIMVLEIAPGPGERSRYLSRLPEKAVGRLLAAPVGAILPRVDREGFTPAPLRHRAEGFQRLDADSLNARWKAAGWEILETCAVAPCVGTEPTRIARIRADPKAWDHLLDLEERVGRQSARWKGAAAVLLAARKSLRTQT
jgi:hypothetical protein